MNNFGSGDYVVTWDQLVIVTAPGTLDPNLLGWSAGANAWLPLTITGQFADFAVEYNEPGGNDDITSVVLMAQPAGLDWTPGFATTAPTLSVNTDPPGPAIVTGSFFLGGTSHVIRFNRTIDVSSFTNNGPNWPGWSSADNRWQPTHCNGLYPGNTTGTGRYVIIDNVQAMTLLVIFGPAIPITCSGGFVTATGKQTIP